ncbi:hypothetical protein V8G54_009901 [Vigna mungo]|uniref:Uncharacterized protein n=1 Tax=Vigna mungo TaxID=3915 RepID=A0AAQ3NVP4_VIGMU
MLYSMVDLVLGSRKMVLVSAYPVANLNTPVPPITGISLMFWLMRFLPNTVMVLPLYFPSVNTKFRTTNKINSLCDVPATKPSILPTTLEVGSGPTVKEVSMNPTVPNKVLELYLGTGGTTKTEVGLLPANLSWK